MLSNTILLELYPGRQNLHQPKPIQLLRERHQRSPPEPPAPSAHLTGPALAVFHGLRGHDEMRLRTPQVHQLHGCVPILCWRQLYIICIAAGQYIRIVDGLGVHIYAHTQLRL